MQDREGLCEPTVQRGGEAEKTTKVTRQRDRVTKRQCKDKLKR